jgi:predicted negative regulator of RcsB-dependent stress response
MQDWSSRISCATLPTVFFEGDCMRTAWLSRFFLALMLAAVCVSAPAPRLWAQDDPAEQAALLVEEGTALFQARNFEQAAIVFQQAYNLDPHPVLLFNIARAHQEMADLPTALRMFREVRDMEADENVTSAANQRIATLEQMLTEQGYDPATVSATDYVPRGFVNITSEPPGATVLIDSAELGVTPLNRGQIDEGTHELRLLLDGYHPITTSIDVRGGGETIRSFTMQERTSLEQYVPPEPGYLSVNAPQSNMEVFVDGQRYSVTPLVQAPLAPGTYEVVVNAVGWISYSTVIEVRSGEQLTVNATMEPVGGFQPMRVANGRRSLANGFLIGGGALVTTGTVFGVLALTNSSSYNDRISDPDRARFRDQARTSALIADITIGTGAALLVTGLILKLTNKSEGEWGGPTPEQLVFAPSIQRRSIGFSFSGSF